MNTNQTIPELTLDTLLSNLGVSGFTKSASENSEDTEKESKEEKGEKKEGKAENSNRPDPEKTDERDEKSPSQSQEAEYQMNKQASINAGVALAVQIAQGLQKSASLVPEQQQALAAEQAPIFQPNPQGTKEEVAAQIVQRLQAAGAGPDDATQAVAPAAPAQTVVPAAPVVPQGAPVEQSPEEENDELQKVAAVLALVDEGLDFDNAVHLVKQAEAQIYEENKGLMKQAALHELMASGYPFEDASELIKQACEEEAPNEDLVKLAFLAEAMDAGLNFEDSLSLLKEASLVPEQQQALAAEQAPIFQPNPQGTKEEVISQLLQRVQAAGAGADDRTQAVAPAAPAQTVAVAPAMTEQEKQAFCSALVREGIDFSRAAALVNEVASL